jgi:hypothetical protein
MDEEEEEVQVEDPTQARALPSGDDRDRGRRGGCPV